MDLNPTAIPPVGVSLFHSRGPRITPTHHCYFRIYKFCKKNDEHFLIVFDERMREAQYNWLCEGPCPVHGLIDSATDSSVGEIHQRQGGVSMDNQQTLTATA